ncbi:MAG: FAD-binding domain-containing protein, partial [Bacteroidales bacterium]|nr:FAD-binding domain-containing protein [Bacteroidales bacterium]
PYEIESFLKELAWRDYFQQVWIAKGNAIDFDLKQPQPNYTNTLLSSTIDNAITGIEAIDNGINNLKQTGYMHNHLRMYVASIACNIGKSYWHLPAKWLYYYLLDADWASNALSWQWVAGSFSSKKYVANQENINKYCHTNQSDTFLDIPYESFETINTPEVLKDLTDLKLETTLPKTQDLVLNNHLPTYLYNFYNLDCNWDRHIHANRILLLEPGFFQKYPVCENTLAFIIGLSKNIENIQIYVGEFDELLGETGASQINYKEHPTANHYTGTQHKRDWMFEEVQGYFPSFFAYWKKCKKYLNTI